MDPDILAALGPVVTTFEANGIEYFIGGSVASSVHGVPRTTIDVDLVANLRPEHVPEISKALRDTYYVDEDMIRRAIRSRTVFNVIHLETMLKLDVYVLKGRPYDRMALDRTQRKELEDGREFPFSTAEDTVLAKLEWYRQGEEISDRQWKDAVGVLRVRSRSLDLDYLRHWAENLGMADLLARALEQAGL